MSPKRKLTVAEIAKKYRTQFPSDNRGNLRRRIRTENPQIFKDNWTNLRNLDRHLKKIFQTQLYQNAEGARLNQHFAAKGIWNPPPDFAFSPKFEEAHRKIREPYEADTDEPPNFPIVPFNWHNWSPYQLRVRLEVRVFLSGKFIGTINDPKGYYNGKASISVEPTRGLRDGRFWLPNDCADSNKETTVEVLARILDQNDQSKHEYIIVKSWTYDPKKNDWYFEPKSFSEELGIPWKTVNSWDLLVNDLKNVGAYLTDIPITKGCPVGQTLLKPQSERIIQGLMMLRGAKTMQTAVKLNIPDEYDAFLFTQAVIDKEEKVTWQTDEYIIKEIEEIFDAYTISYRIAKLVKPFEPGVVALNW